MIEYVLIDDDFEIYRQELEEKDIPSILGHGITASIIRLDNGNVERASVEDGKVTLKEPELILE